MSEGLVFSLYPNPAKTEITVEMNSQDKEVTLVVEDILGHALVTKTISSLQNQTKIDLSPFSEGVYIVELRLGDKRAVKKFVINR